MSPRTIRAQRLIDLYALRVKVVAEIADIEATMQREADAAARLRADCEAFEAAYPTRRRAVAECGTDGGYHRHRRQLKETPCAACRMAHSAAERDRRARAVAS